MHAHLRRRPCRGRFQWKELPLPRALLFVLVRYAPYFTAICIADYRAMRGVEPVMCLWHVHAHARFNAGGRGGPRCMDASTTLRFSASALQWLRRQPWLVLLCE